MASRNPTVNETWLPSRKPLWNRIAWNAWATNTSNAPQRNDRLLCPENPLAISERLPWHGPASQQSATKEHSDRQYSSSSRQCFVSSSSRFNRTSRISRAGRVMRRPLLQSSAFNPLFFRVNPFTDFIGNKSDKTETLVLATQPTLTRKLVTWT